VRSINVGMEGNCSNKPGGPQSLKHVEDRRSRSTRIKARGCEGKGVNVKQRRSKNTRGTEAYIDGAIHNSPGDRRSPKEKQQRQSPFHGTDVS
jgi:hypothetical protein